MEKSLVFHEASCSTCCAAHLICSHYPHPSLALLFPSPLQYEGSSSSSRFLSRPSNLFLPLQDKYCVRGLCFPPAPSQRIYDGPAVLAISQGRVFTVEVC